MRSERAFTLVELLVVIAVIAILIGVLLPALAGARVQARKTANSMQLRAIHQGMIVFGNSNDTYFPGLDSRGKMIGPKPVYSGSRWPDLDRDDEFEGLVEGGNSASTRLALMLNWELVEPEMLISPGDPDAVPARPGKELDADGLPQGQLNTFSPGGNKIPNFSYAMLWLVPRTVTPEQIAREREWRTSGSHRAVMLVDRVLGSPYWSIWTKRPGPEQPPNWQGTVVWNDNSTSFEQSHVIQDTKYGSLPTCSADDIFAKAERDAQSNIGAGYVQWD